MEEIDDQIGRGRGHAKFLSKVSSHIKFLFAEIFTFLYEGLYVVDQNLDFLFVRPAYVLSFFKIFFFDRAR